MSVANLFGMSVRDILGAASRADRRERSVAAEWGTVGWPEDNDPFDYGPGWDDGMTLAKVTLYRGRRAGYGKPLEPGIAAGIRVLAHIDARLWKTLPAGTRVCVIFPRGDMQTPANGFIAFVADKSPATGFDATTMMLPIPDGSVMNIGDANAVLAALSTKVDNLFALIVAAFNGHSHASNGATPTPSTPLKIPLVDGAGTPPSTVAAAKVKIT